MSEEIRVAKEQGLTFERKMQTIESQIAVYTGNGDNDMAPEEANSEKYDLIQKALRLDAQAAELKQEQKIIQMKMAISQKINSSESTNNKDNSNSANNLLSAKG